MDPMHRRLLLCALACRPAARVPAQNAPHFKISAAELYRGLAKHFPLRFGLADLLQLQVSAPRLDLLPERNKLGAMLRAEASGRGLRDVPPGELDLVFALRYERADRTVRARDPELLDLRLPGLADEARRTLLALLPALLREQFGEVVLHRFAPGELGLADTMGLEPAGFVVENDGLLVTFAAKPP
jgi:hypothetical protein